MKDAISSRRRKQKKKKSKVAPVQQKWGKMDKLKELDIWCEAQISLMEESLESKLMSKHRKERIKNQIIGIDKVRARIKRMML